MRIIGISQGVPSSIDTRLRTPTEEQVTSLWVDLLDPPSGTIGLRDSFFDLGGTSLLAARLIARLEQAFGVRVPLETLIESPNIADLASLLDSPRCSASQNGSSLLVSINTRGHRPPLFCLPGIGGHMSSMRGLAQSLGPDVPLYGLEAVGVGGRETPLSSVEAIAERFLTEIRRVQPHGPYFFCGHSFGGLVAYELTQQIRAVGEQVNLLILLDTSAPRPVQVSANLLLRAVRRQTEREWREAVRPVRYLGKNFQRLRVAARLLMRRGSDPSETGLPSWFRDVRRANIRAVRLYRGRPSQVPLLLVLAKQRKLVEPLFSWQDLTRGPIQVVTVNGNHVSMLEPEHIAGVGEVVTQYLRAAQLEEK